MNTPPGNADTQILAVVAILLRQGTLLDRLSRAITVAALIAFAALGMIADRPPMLAMGLLAAVVFVGLVELWFAIRVAIDAALFHDLSRSPGGPNWAALDDALMCLEMMPPAKAGRPEAARIAGARRLLRFQAAALIVQLGLAAACAVFGAVR